MTLRVEGDAPRALAGRRPVGLPDRAGGPDERAQARARRARRGRVRYIDSSVELEIADDGTGVAERGRQGPRPRRHARARRAVRRHARGRAARAAAASCCARSCRSRRRAVIRILLVDDQALVRAGFRMILDAEPEMEVVGEAARRARGDRPGARAAPRRRADGHSHAGARRPRGDAADHRDDADDETPKILMLTTFDLDEYVYEALRAGASGFLLKDTPPEQLVGGDPRDRRRARRCCRRRSRGA